MAEVHGLAELLFGFAGILQKEIGHAGLVVRFIELGGFPQGGLKILQGGFGVIFCVQLFLEDRIGSLEPGKDADIAVWDRDLYSIPSDDIKNIRCELTFLRGKVVYAAPGSK